MQLCLLYGKLFTSRDEGVRCWSSAESKVFAKELTDTPSKCKCFPLMHRQSRKCHWLPPETICLSAAEWLAYSLQPLEPLLCISKISHAYPTLFFPFILIPISSYSSTTAINWAFWGWGCLEVKCFLREVFQLYS